MAFTSYLTGKSYPDLFTLNQADAQVMAAYQAANPTPPPPPPSMTGMLNTYLQQTGQQTPVPQAPTLSSFKPLPSPTPTFQTFTPPPPPAAMPPLSSAVPAGGVFDYSSMSAPSAPTPAKPGAATGGGLVAPAGGTQAAQFPALVAPVEDVAPQAPPLGPREISSPANVPMPIGETVKLGKGRDPEEYIANYQNYGVGPSGAYGYGDQQLWDLLNRGLFA